jgi:hypothetical protein
MEDLHFISAAFWFSVFITIDQAWLSAYLSRSTLPHLQPKSTIVHLSMAPAAATCWPSPASIHRKEARLPFLLLLRCEETKSVF